MMYTLKHLISVLWWYVYNTTFDVYVKGQSPMKKTLSIPMYTVYRADIIHGLLMLDNSDATLETPWNNI